MSSFKEIKRKEIEKGNEKGNEGLKKGEQRIQELRQVKSLIDSIKITDNEDLDLVEGLNESYLEAGKEAHKGEVQEVVNAATQDLDKNKVEISKEKSNVENATDRVREMQSTTDLAQSASHSVENSLKKSAEEYESMEQQTEEIETQLTSNSQDILNRIEGLFSKK